MRGRGTTTSLAASPVLVGAVTVLVTIVAVFLSYNANTGLPFVPTYDLKANLPNAAQLVKGFEVRIGGARVGQVSKIEPMRRDDGSTYAQITMKLDKEIEPLKADTTLLVRPRSAIGLKYVELKPGDGQRTFPSGRDDPGGAGAPRGGRAGRAVQHVRREGPRRLAQLARRLRRRPGRPRPRHQHRDRRAGAAARGPRAGGGQPGRSRDADRPLLQGARRRGLRGRLGRRDAGGAVREPRHHLHRARLDRAAVPAGVDLRGAAQRGAGDPRVPAPAAVPAQQRRLLPRAAARRRHAAALRADPRGRLRGRHRDRCPRRFR